MDSKITYLKIYIIISAVSVLIYITAQWFLLNKAFYIQSVLFCLIPFFISLVIFWIGKYTSIKHPKITKITANIINIISLLLPALYITVLGIIFSAFSDLENMPEYTKIEDYPKALKSYTADAVQYFPYKIPENAENISMLRTPSSFTGDSDFYLKFDIDKDYIENEKQKFQNKSEIIIFDKDNYFAGGSHHETDAASILNNIISGSVKGWEVYLLERHQCFHGIAFKDNTIIYILYCD